MKIQKPHSIILSKKFPDRYFDHKTDEEFPYEEINEYPRWYKLVYDQWGNKIYYEDCDGYWAKFEYNINGKLKYYEDETGFWYKHEYNNGNFVYYEDSRGRIINHRL